MRAATAARRLTLGAVMIGVIGAAVSCHFDPAYRDVPDPGAVPCEMAPQVPVRLGRKTFGYFGYRHRVPQL